MEPVNIRLEVAAITEWPDERLEAAYEFLSRRVATTLELPDHRQDRQRLGEHRGLCEQAGLEMVRRGLL